MDISDRRIFYWNISINKLKIRGKRQRKKAWVFFVVSHGWPIPLFVKKIFSYHKKSPRSQSSMGSLSTRRRPLYRADIKTKSKWHLHLGFAYINVRYLSEIGWPEGIRSRILSYRYRSDIDCYSGQIPLRHRMVKVVPKMGLIDIASISGIISDRDSVADDRAISKWHNNLSIAD